jgi:hypothetical protein
MRESDTYQAILDEGRVEGARRMILLQGRIRFGPPTRSIKARLAAITDIDRLERQAVHLLNASSWKEVLDLP